MELDKGRTGLGLLAAGFFARSMAFCLSLHGGDDWF
jgi:hypothetical protein